MVFSQIKPTPTLEHLRADRSSSRLIDDADLRQSTLIFPEPK